MGHGLFQENERAQQIFRTADEKLDFPLSELIFNGTQQELTVTYNAQPALLTTSYAFVKELEEAGIKPDYTAGHSLGEYTALVASGAISFEDAVYTVRKRGEFMEAAVPNGQGSMAAILGMDREALSEVTSEITATGESVQLANINCPGKSSFQAPRKGLNLRVQKLRKMALNGLCLLKLVDRSIRN